jgi:hypothetical protein
MNNAVFTDLARDVLDEARDLLVVKGHDYQGADADRLVNFKDASRAAGVTPLQAWRVLLEKHLTAIKSYDETGRAASQSMRERFVDLVNYGILGLAIVHDMEDVGVPQSPEEDEDEEQRIEVRVPGKRPRADP